MTEGTVRDDRIKTAAYEAESLTAERMYRRSAEDTRALVHCFQEIDEDLFYVIKID